MFKMQLQTTSSFLVSFWYIVFGSKSTIDCNNEGRNMCTKGCFLNLKYVFSLSLIFYYLANPCLHFCIPSRMMGYKIAELSDGYWTSHESYNNGGSRGGT